MLCFLLPLLVPSGRKAAKRGGEGEKRKEGNWGRPKSDLNSDEVYMFVLFLVCFCASHGEFRSGHPILPLQSVIGREKPSPTSQPNLLTPYTSAGWTQKKPTALFPFPHPPLLFPIRFLPKKGPFLLGRFFSVRLPFPFLLFSYFFGTCLARGKRERRR